MMSPSNISFIFLILKTQRSDICMSLTLYWNLASQPARSVKALLDIAKIKCNLITIDISKNQQLTKEYLLLNPLGQIPFLVDGKFKVGESNAILIYLAEKYPEILSQYYGTTPQTRAIVNQHLSWYQNFFRPALFRIIFLKLYENQKYGKTIHASQIKGAEKQLLEILKEFEIVLSKSKGKFVTGDQLTLADLQFYFEMTNMILYKRSFHEFQHISEWYRRVEEVPEVQKITEEWKKLVPALSSWLESVPVKGSL